MQSLVRLVDMQQMDMKSKGVFFVFNARHQTHIIAIAVLSVCHNGDSP